MRRLSILIAVIVITWPVAALAVTGVSVGGKLGYAKYTGDVLPSSGDVGNTLMYGAILEVATFPVFDLELHANYASKSFTYSYDVAGSTVSSEFDFRDIHVLALAKKNLIAVPMSPLGLYVGGGVGWHLINTEVAKNSLNNLSQADDPVELLSNSAKFSGHGLIGVKLGPPMAPIALYGEARIGRIFTDNALNTSSIEGGLLLKF